MIKKVKKAVPELRFPEFTGDWEIDKISKLFSVTAGGDIDSSKVRKERDAIYQYPIYANAEKDKGLYGYSNEYKIEPYVITIAGRGVNIGITHVRDHRFYPIVRLLVLKHKVNLSIYFFEYQINKLNIFVESTGIPQLTAPQISTYKVSFPPLQEQQKIAKFLSACDEKLNKLRRKRKLLETYKRGVMQQLFTQKIRFQNDEGSDFPDWEEKKLGDIGIKKIQKNSDNKINKVLTNSATMGVVEQQDYFYRDIANADNLGGYYIIEKGDYVYNPRISFNAPVGPINKNKIDIGVMSPLYTVFGFKDDENTFFEKYFKTSLWHKYMCSVANHGARHDRMNITTSDFMQLPLPYPSKKEQQKIAQFLTAIDRKIEAIGQQIEKMETFKKGLLQKMFV